MHIDFETEDKELVNRFRHVSSTLAYVSIAYANLKAYMVDQIPYEDDHQRAKPVLRFHKDSFLYILTVQACKLLEHEKRNSPALSSILVLNEKLHEKYPDGHTKFHELKETLDTLRESGVSSRLLDLRHKTYAHSDDHELNEPLRFSQLSIDEIKQVGELIVDFETFYNICYNLYDRSHGFKNLYDDSSPHNYLKTNFRARAFFYQFGNLSKLRNLEASLRKAQVIFGDSEITNNESKRKDALNELQAIQDFVSEMEHAALAEVHQRMGGIQPF